MIKKTPVETPVIAEIQPLLQEITALIEQSRNTVQQTVNTVMMQSYWHIGRLIIEYEQQGQSRAAYGKQQLKYLSQQLNAQFGKGFDASNLRRFYQAFPIWETLSLKLSWSHFNLLARIENPKARDWYMREALATYSVLADNQQLFASKYLAYLPSDETLQQELQQERFKVQMQLMQQAEQGRDAEGEE
ncbi:MAG: DUF1016 family protein [Methylomarinum sp.]|nr:DUF1016 family protein [Methylomarinum sp.]